MWFDSWSDVLRVLLVGAAAYLSLILVLRISGKRTLAKLNAFDLVVTVALGSTLATILLSSDVAYLEGVVALGVLIVLQYLAAFASSRLSWVRTMLTARPTLLVDRGTILESAMAQQRVSHSEIRQAVRTSGAGGLNLIAAVVLETDGSLSVITMEQLGDGSALSEIRDFADPNEPLGRTDIAQ